MIFTDTHLLLIACQDGTVIVHTVRRGLFLRTLRPPGDGCVPAQISALQVGMEGHIVVQTSQGERANRKVRELTQCAGTDTSSTKCLKLCLLLQGTYSVYVYSVNGCLLASFTTEEQVTAVHLVSEHVILGSLQGSLHVRDLYRSESEESLNCALFT